MSLGRQLKIQRAQEARGGRSRRSLRLFVSVPVWRQLYARGRGDSANLPPKATLDRHGAASLAVSRRNGRVGSGEVVARLILLKSKAMSC